MDYHLGALGKGPGRDLMETRREQEVLRSALETKDRLFTTVLPLLEQVLLILIPTGMGKRAEGHFCDNGVPGTPPVIL